MKKAPSIFGACELISTAKETQVRLGGEWVIARPFGYFSFKHRIKCAWMVFTGKADALIWPKNQ
jgi:hypothetical protein